MLIFHVDMIIYLFYKENIFLMKKGNYLKRKSSSEKIRSRSHFSQKSFYQYRMITYDYS